MCVVYEVGEQCVVNAVYVACAMVLCMNFVFICVLMSMCVCMPVCH